MSSSVRECAKCVLNSNDDATIIIDKYGVCNYCNSYDDLIKKLGNEDQRKEWLNNKIIEIKENGKGKKYDCLIGLSGGTDSTFMAYWAFKEGLNPLVIHLDNGWNSELAVKNIENVCAKLNYDLHTHVIDWEEFKNLQLAYLRASVIDIEILTDHAISAIMYKMAQKYKIRYTLSGFNYATEAIMPKGWTYDKTDYSNLKDIVLKYGGINKFKTYPTITFWKKLYYKFFLKLESIRVLNYIEYNKKYAQEIITKELDWKDYGGKHYESLFTKFYQAYILPVKFGVDKRKAHLSSLICSGQITKEEAQKELSLPLYDEKEFISEKEYILKKMLLSEIEFNNILKEKVRLHSEFDTDQKYWNIYFFIIRVMKKILGRF